MIRMKNENCITEIEKRNGAFMRLALEQWKNGGGHMSNLNKV